MKNVPTKKELLKSPVRGWNDTAKVYNRILLVPAGTKHDSGYMHIAIVGVTDVDGQETYEICGYPDDISLIADTVRYGKEKEYQMAKVRMDCLYPSGILRYHGRGTFKVSSALSSMEIFFIDSL